MIYPILRHRPRLVERRQQPAPQGEVKRNCGCWTYSGPKVTPSFVDRYKYKHRKEGKTAMRQHTRRNKPVHPGTVSDVILLCLGSRSALSLLLRRCLSSEIFSVRTSPCRRLQTKQNYFHMVVFALYVYCLWFQLYGTLFIHNTLLFVWTYIEKCSQLFHKLRWVGCHIRVNEDCQLKRWQPSYVLLWSLVLR
jgi:hypothetical protein